MARKMKDILRCKDKQNNYDENSLSSIWEYTLKIEGKTLLQILHEAKLSNQDIEWVKTKECDKGLPGKIIEAAYFGYELNSRQEADFEKAGAELKSTPADMDNATKQYKAGETISITQIDFRNPIEVDFYKSHLYEKLKMLIIIFYHRDKSLESKLDYKVFYASLFQPSEEQLLLIEQDYKKINEKIISGQADKLSRSDGIFLSTAPKARRSTNMITPYYGGEKIVKRSYTLRKNIVDVILKGYYKRKRPEERLITDINELKQYSFEQIIQNRISPYLGLPIIDIMQKINLQAEQKGGVFSPEKLAVEKLSKATLSTIAARMFGLKRLHAQEFTSANIVAKTVYFNCNGTNKEKFRLADADFMEICNINEFSEIEIDENGAEIEVKCSGWENSALYSLLNELRYLFIVFQQNAEGNIIFRGCKIWGMSDEDIELAHQDWMDMRQVLIDGVKLTIGTDGRTYNNFPGVAEARIVHLRPHGEKAFYVGIDGQSWGNGQISDTEELPDGRRMTRQSYWLNNSFVKEIVKELLVE